ncbi:transcriptional repressor LexA [Planctomycetota bacterium]
MQLKTTPAKRHLTPRQMQLLKAIAQFESSHCYLPTIGELAEQLGISRSTAFEHIAELRRKAMLTRSPGRARSLILTAQAQKLLSKLNAPAQSSISGQSGAIPFAGRVAAGIPIEAIEDRQALSLTSHFGNAENTFALEVTGDSMIDDDINDGDMVICKPAKTAANGELVIAIVDDDNATLKRFYKEPDKIRLQPANENYAPIYTNNCRIQAVVVGLVRKL